MAAAAPAAARPPLAELSTPRLRLRPMTLGDLEAVHSMVGDWEVAKWTGSWEHPPSLEHTRGKVDAYAASVGRQWALELHPTPPMATTPTTPAPAPVFVGCIGFVVGEGDDGAEVGYMLAREHWGHGYATEALQAVCAAVCGELGQRRVKAVVSAANAGSRRVLDKCGFVLQAGSEAHFCTARGCDVDCVTYLLEAPPDQGAAAHTA